MNRTIKLLSLASLSLLAITNCTAGKVKAEVEVNVSHDAKVLAKKTALYAAPFFVYAAASQILLNKSNFMARNTLGIRRAYYVSSLLAGACAAYCLPKAHKIS